MTQKLLSSIIKYLKIRNLIKTLFLNLLLVTPGIAENHSESMGPSPEKEKFKAGEMILDHIKDAHDWHIMDIGGHPISIPLPVIVLTTDRGIVCFSSSKFEHGHKQHEGFALHKGKIIRVSSASEGESHFDPDHMTYREASLSEYFNGMEGAFIDISITKNVFAIFISIILLCLIFISVGRAYRRNPGTAPRGLQSFMEPLILFVRDEVAKPSIGPHYEKFLPFLLTVFFFIFINNLMGLIPIFPGGANVTGNIAVTMVLAIFVFIITQVNGNKYYWKHIFLPDVPGWLLPLMIPIELMGVFLKPFILMLRLFANITAGHIIVLAFFSLIFIFGEMNPAGGFGVSIVSVAFSLFMNCLELLVAFIQAYVFTFLAALYFGMATEKHHH